MQPVVLEGVGLRLDEPNHGDIATIFEHCQDPVFERYLTVPWPYGLDDAAYFVEKHVPRGWQSGNELTWAIRRAAGAELLGVIGFRVARSDLGFWLGAPHRGEGIMPAAVRLVAAHLLDSGLASTLRWECVVGNVASLAVARKCGFSFAGVAPAHVTARDGTHPESWHGVLRRGDSLDPKAGWPEPRTAESLPWTE